MGLILPDELIGRKPIAIFSGDSGPREAHTLMRSCKDALVRAESHLAERELSALVTSLARDWDETAQLCALYCDPIDSEEEERFDLSKKAQRARSGLEGVFAAGRHRTMRQFLDAGGDVFAQDCHGFLFFRHLSLKSHIDAKAAERFLTGALAEHPRPPRLPLNFFAQSVFSYCREPLLLEPLSRAFPEDFSRALRTPDLFGFSPAEWRLAASFGGTFGGWEKAPFAQTDFFALKVAEDAQAPRFLDKDGRLDALFKSWLESIEKTLRQGKTPEETHERVSSSAKEALSAAFDYATLVCSKPEHLTGWGKTAMAILKTSPKAKPLAEAFEIGLATRNGSAAPKARLRL